jgi:hypothetical protein
LRRFRATLPTARLRYTVRFMSVVVYRSASWEGAVNFSLCVAAQSTMSGLL